MGSIYGTASDSTTYRTVHTVNRIKPFLHFLLLLLTINCCFDINARAKADNIISVTGNIEGLASFIGGSSSQVLAASWSSSQTYDNVQISASIGSLDPNFVNGTAFLTSKIGPDVTASDVIAAKSFVAPLTPSYSSPVTNTLLFSGLFLQPGTYFLVLSGSSSSTNPLYWNDNGVVNISVGTGVTSVQGIFFASGNSANPPSLNFSFSDVDKPFFDATGNLVPAFAGTPGRANCHRQSVSALARQYGELNNAAAALDFPSVQALQKAIRDFCEPDAAAELARPAGNRPHQ